VVFLKDFLEGLLDIKHHMVQSSGNRPEVYWEENLVSYPEYEVHCLGSG
jgi:hypothetical protein